MVGVAGGGTEMAVTLPELAQTSIDVCGKYVFNLKIIDRKTAVNADPATAVPNLNTVLQSELAYLAGADLDLTKTVSVSLDKYEPIFICSVPALLRPHLERLLLQGELSVTQDDEANKYKLEFSERKAKEFKATVAKDEKMWAHVIVDPETPLSDATIFEKVKDKFESAGLWIHGDKDSFSRTRTKDKERATNKVSVAFYIKDYAQIHHNPMGNEIDLSALKNITVDDDSKEEVKVWFPPDNFRDIFGTRTCDVCYKGLSHCTGHKKPDGKRKAGPSHESGAQRIKAKAAKLKGQSF